MWLTLDIGNSAAKGGLYRGNTLEHVFHIDFSAPPFRGPDASAAWERAFRAELDAASVERIGVTSVVPNVMPAATRALRRLTGTEAERLRTTMRLPFELAYRTPETLGIDRLAAAAGAWDAHGAHESPPRSVIALDAGTAVTLEVVTHGGVYRGGVIAPGPALLRRALHDGTAQLPAVPLEWPNRLVGRSTQEALQSGIMGGFVESTRGLLRRVESTLDGTCFVVATGGWRQLLIDHIEEIDHVNPHLVLDGVRVLMAMNPPDAPRG
jgi:type III pantothenate kinase